MNLKAEYIETKGRSAWYEPKSKQHTLSLRTWILCSVCLINFIPWCLVSIVELFLGTWFLLLKCIIFQYFHGSVFLFEICIISFSQKKKSDYITRKTVFLYRTLTIHQENCMYHIEGDLLETQAFLLRRLR